MGRIAIIKIAMNMYNRIKKIFGLFYFVIANYVCTIERFSNLNCNSLSEVRLRQVTSVKLTYYCINDEKIICNFSKPCTL